MLRYVRRRKEEKNIPPMDFTEYLKKNQAFQRTAKFTEIKGIAILVKVHKIYSIDGRDMKVELNDQSFLLEPLKRPCFIKRTESISFSRFLITFFL